MIEVAIVGDKAGVIWRVMISTRWRTTWLCP